MKSNIFGLRNASDAALTAFLENNTRADVAVMNFISAYHWSLLLILLPLI